ncbi:MAG: TonB-dependent receptor [Caulobacterales bacterium]
MKYAISRAALAAALIFPTAAFAEETVTDDPIVITATRAEGGVPRNQIGGSVTLFSAQDLEARQVRVLSDVLRDAPGVEVSRSGVIGGQTAVRIRGAEGNHTLVMIDGMDISDPFNQEVDFGTFIADDFARVEVLRGQQSALYGSDAIGGVIHYITATGADAPGASARVEGGSFGTGQMAVRVAGVNGPLDWAISGNVYDTEGTPNVPGGSRDLGFESKTLSGRFALTLTENLSLTAMLRTRDSSGDFNEDLDFDGLNDDSPGVYYTDEATYGLLRADLSTFNEAWTHSVTVQGVEAQKAGYSSFLTNDEGERLKASYVTSVQFGGDSFSQRVTGAIDYREDSFRSLSFPQEETIEQTGAVLEYNALIGQRFGFGAAMRRDDNDRYDDSNTYRVQASYAFDTGTRLRAAAGTGVKNPNMTELFGYGAGYIGNLNLTPEESQGWEIGVEQYLFDRTLLIGATYFDNELNDEIRLTGFAPATPVNLTGTSTQTGVELFANAKLGANWRVDLAYTYLDADEPVAGGGSRPEIRRAENTASANVSWRSAGERFGANLNIRYNGAQWDDNFTTFPASAIELDGFTLVNAGANWRFTEALELYGRVENLTDEEYQEVYGYQGVGRAAYIGLKAGF